MEREKNKKIFVKNIYYMLSYVFDYFREDSYEKISGEEFEDAKDLFAALFIKEVSGQLKQGLYKEYKKERQILRTVRGKILPYETMILKVRERDGGKIACEFDELSENNIWNQILKTTLYFFVREDEVAADRKRQIRKILTFFDQVDILNPRKIPWRQLQISRANRSYEGLINLSYFVLDGLILNMEDGSYKMQILSEDHMERLYEKFVLAYYKRHYKELDEVRARQICWKLDEEYDRGEGCENGEEYDRGEGCENGEEYDRGEECENGEEYDRGEECENGKEYDRGEECENGKEYDKNERSENGEKYDKDKRQKKDRKECEKGQKKESQLGKKTKREREQNFEFLPVMKTDITLKKGEQILIIDTKYYQNNLQERYGKKTIHSNNLYQIFAYVKNLDAQENAQKRKQERVESEKKERERKEKRGRGEGKERKRIEVSGILLYAKTEGENVPDCDYKMSGNQIGVRTLDLGVEFSKIREKLDGIVKEFFKGLA